MTDHLSLLVVAAATLMPVRLGAAPPPVRLVMFSPAPDRVAWLERFEQSRSGPEATQTVTRTFKTGPGGSLDVSNLSGGVVVTGVAGDTIQMTAVKRARGGNAKAELDNIDIDATETAGRVEIRTNFRRRESHAEVDYTIEAPFETAVIARSISGDVRVTGVRGDVQIDSTSGDVAADATPRLVRLKTISGDVTLTNVGSVDTLSTGTVSGDLVAKNLKARSLEVVTISGDVTLENSTCERAQIRSVNGGVLYIGALAKGGRYEVNSHSGDIEFRLVGEVGFEITAHTFSGDVRADLPLQMAPHSGDAGIPGMPGNHEIRGTFGDGSALVVVKTFSGDIIIGRAGGDKRKDNDKPNKKNK
jgi:DUF4097 and DUF4098 domain-containing protein YvlB